MCFKRSRLAMRLLLALLLTSAHGAIANADELKPFQATYTWKWHSVTVASSSLTLAQLSADTWSYSSKSEPRGLVGAVRSEHPTQLSIVQISNDHVRPLSYKAEDGTKATNRDADVKFDWQTRRAFGFYDDIPVDLPLDVDVQDDLSVQLAMFVQLLKGAALQNSTVINKNSVREYRYVREGDEVVATPMGRINTVIYRSERPNSSRVTRFWCAPSKGYLPMRVEQKKADSVEWTMEVNSLQRE